MVTDLNFGLAQIEQVALPVKDLERAVAFYQKKLGMKHMFSSNGLAFFDCAGVRLMLSRPEGPEQDHPGSVIYFKVADIHQAYQILSGRGVSFLDSPHRIADMGSYELWMAFFHDSEQNVLAIAGEIPHAKSDD